MSQRDYRRGFEDGQAAARSMAEALKGPDRTQYEFVGGPFHGQRKETGGSLYHFAAVIPPIEVTYGPYSLGSISSSSIRRGRYKRTDIAGGDRPRRTVYVYEGEE